MEHAEQRGDRQTARSLARSILSADKGAASEKSAGEVARAKLEQPKAEHAQPEEPDLQISARELLARTEPDPFLLVVGILGLGLMVWLVYNYAL